MGSSQMQASAIFLAIFTWKLLPSSSPPDAAPGLWPPGRNKVRSGTQRLSYKYKATHVSGESLCMVYLQALSDADSILSTMGTGKEGSSRSRDISRMCIL